MLRLRSVLLRFSPLSSPFTRSPCGTPRLPAVTEFITSSCFQQAVPQDLPLPCLITVLCLISGVLYCHIFSSFRHNFCFQTSPFPAQLPQPRSVTTMVVLLFPLHLCKPNSDMLLPPGPGHSSCRVQLHHLLPGLPVASQILAWSWCLPMETRAEMQAENCSAGEKAGFHATQAGESWGTSGPDGGGSFGGRGPWSTPKPFPGSAPTTCPSPVCPSLCSTTRRSREPSAPSW